MNEIEKWECIDALCGAGGSSDGLIQSKKAIVTHAINHSEAAIYAHTLRHPDVIHIQSDIRAKETAKQLPTKTDLFWLSLECTNYSQAKGGQSRNADSRTLANETPRFIEQTDPNYIVIENVKEFLQWGDLIPKRDESGKKMKVRKGKDKGKTIMVPNPDKKGQSFLKWKHKIMSMGYTYSHRLLNAADFGAHTSRTRLFIVFAKEGYPVAWPDPTHSKEGSSGLFGLKPWKACKERIDLTNEGKSIFGRKTPLVENTLKRIAYGMKKYCTDDKFIMKYYSNGGQWSSINEPLHTVRTKDCHVLVEIDRFITQNIHKNLKANTGVNVPLGSILTSDEKALVTVKKQFITKYYGGDKHATELNKPLATIRTKDSNALVTVKEQFIAKQQYGSDQVSSLQDPLHTIVTKGRQQLITIEKKQFIDKYCTNEHNVSSIDNPLGVITTQGGPALVTVEKGGYILHDIKMRFLSPKELAEITGFENWESLGRTKTEQLKHIGNAVPPVLAEKIIDALWDVNHISSQSKVA